MGVGNTVINHGVIQGLNSAAIWFEDQVSGVANTIDNYGTIQTGSGTGSVLNVIGNNSQGSVNFINRTGAVVYGSLSFANGNDTLTLFPGSVITGGFNGGGGTNTLTLAGEAGSNDTLPGNISNFQTLTKTGEGTWTLSGTVAASGGSPLAVDIQQGVLALTGNNTNFNGSVTVRANGTLRARAQSLPPSVTNNGLVHFAQPDNGTYAGTISGTGAVTKTDAGTLTLTGNNTYSGGTTINGGVLQISSDANLGAASGALGLDGGTLRTTANITSARTTTLGSGGGSFDVTSGTSLALTGNIAGPGELTKTGTGALVLSGTNSYSGGTTISQGTLQLGNGGASGSILGDVANDGTLAFNRSDTYTFDGEISGSGGLAQIGSGITILTADNTYAGATTISNGWLYVNGDQTDADGPTVAQCGTRLGGDGIVGGDVTIEGGATLGPGSVPQTPATLTIDGDLTLEQGSILFYNMVQANVAGGQLNDLTDVAGNLNLNGAVINVVDQGQTLGPGVYRVINYGGTLTLDNDGLTIGSYMTAPATPGEVPVVTRPLDGVFVQTSIPGQVNLVNAAGATLNYWDGPINHGNNVINGGSGSWLAAPPPDGNDNWTDATGTPAAPWTDAAYAIFMATPGTVQVDNSEGAVRARGMQFASHGYVVTGDAITLVPDLAIGGVSYIRVGDGTTAGSSMTATISAELTGTAALIKDDLGTLILAGTNTHTGGTGIFSGTLQISADENLGASTSTLVIANGSTLRTTDTFSTDRMVILGSTGAGSGTGIIETQGAGTVLTVNGAIVDDPAGGNPGTLVKAGAGTLILTSDGNAYDGGTMITQGTLQLGNGGASGSILGDVANDGTLAFNRSDTYTFDGEISGSGGLEQIGTGTTILTADSDYSGGTTISQGTLQLGNGGTSGSILGDVANDGTLAFNRADTYTFDGEISGSGSVRQIGTGTTILTAENDYSGGTTISQGTLQLGNGGMSGSIIGNVTNNGTLVVDRSDEVTLPGQIVGSGSLVQQGTGTTILTGNNTYSGGTTITQGTLQLGDGGESGNITGDIQNDGTLAFNRSDLLIVIGTIDGTGNVIQDGPGATVLLGDNTYDGTTDVNNGTLYINGDQSGAAGETTVTGDAALGGTGTIGGNVTFLSGGATLTPGDVGTVPGTLTIVGNLTLASDSILTYQFGQAGVVGGPLNDLTVVGGALTAAGTLNVETTESGSFDPGVYRVISYAGAFTDNGLTVGTIPSPDFFLQTGISGQVNLVNTAGLVFNYWDGGPAQKNSNTVDGGTGTWIRSEPGDDASWTGPDGALNAAWNDGAFAIFGATAGTVAVDNSAGQVQASGMQFLTDGYIITDEPLELVELDTMPGTSIIRVGDGSELGAGYTATINAVLFGDTTLVKTDLGTLVLDADNLYSGGTAINGGVLQIASDTNLGLAGTALGLDGGTLRTMADITSARATTLGEQGGTFETMTATTFTLAGTADGEGSLTKIGEGTMILTADNSYAGGTIINGGVLQISSDANLDAADGSLGIDGGTLHTTADITSNRGTVLDDGGGTFETAADTTFTLSGLVGGPGALTKTGDGAMVLTAENLYSGGTTISAGTLQLGNGGTSGSILGGVANDGTLAFNRSDTYTFDGDIFGGGAVDQIGTGTTILTGSNSYSGPTSVLAGTLQAGAADTFSASSEFSVSSGAHLNLAGFDQTIAGLANAGLVSTSGAPGTTLTIAGNYAGNGGLLALNTYLGDDSSVSDRLVIDGGTASGSTSLLVTNVGGQGARTTGNGILVIDVVNGGTTEADAFSLGAPAVAGPYEYSLYRGGIDGSTPDHWYLRSILDCSLAPTLPICAETPPNYRPETSLYTAIPSLALDYGNLLLSNLDERMGGQRSFRLAGVNPHARYPADLGWGRIVGMTGSRDGGSLGIYGNDGPSYDYDVLVFQTGLDLYREEHEDDSFDNAGVYFAYGQAGADVDHFGGIGAGSIDLTGLTLGGYWTHFGATGWYLDSIVHGTWYDIDASGRLSGVSTDGFGFGTSLEAGYPFRFGNSIILEPQAQLTYQTINLDSMRDVGADIRFDDIQSLVGRIGVRLSQRWDLGERKDGSDNQQQVIGWIRGSLTNEFLGEPTTSFSSDNGYVPFQAGMQGAGFKLDTGFDSELADDVSFYGSIDFQQSFNSSHHAIGGRLGLKVRF